MGTTLIIMRPIIHSICLTVVFGFMYFSANCYGSQLIDSEDNLQLFFYTQNRPFYFIILEKETQRLKLYEQLETTKLIKEFTCSTGEGVGQKNTSGDEKTPEGVYYITEIYKDKKVSVFGSRAFHLDYPNVFDTLAGRRGDGIFIHGTNKDLIPNSTNGCVALKNSDLDELAPYLVTNTIPVIILTSLSAPVLGKNLRLETTSKQFKEILSNISFNLQKYPLETIQNLSFIKQKNQAIVSVSYKDIDDTSIKYQSRQRVYVSQSPSRYWRTVSATQSVESPYILARQPLKYGSVAKVDVTDNKSVKKSKDKDLVAFIELWRSAWVSKDIQKYMNYYSPSFRGGRLNREGWRAKKAYLSKKYNYINVTIKDIVIEYTDSGANISFYQSYKSDQYQANGTKYLQVVYRDNQWLIEKEDM